jgi:hypothetical protein
MIGLTNIELKIVMNAARLLPVEKRDIFLAAHCRHAGSPRPRPIYPIPMLLRWRSWP